MVVRVLLDDFWYIVTRFGMLQLWQQFSDQRLREMLDALGYDDTLYSHKSRVFVLTFHSDRDIRVKICNAIHTDINEKALNLGK